MGNAECLESGDRASCRCPAGYQGDPLVSCKRRTVVGAKEPKARPQPRNIIVIGQQYSPDGSSTQVQQSFAEGRSLGSNRSRSNLAVIGSTRKRRFLKLLGVIKE